MHRLRVTFAYRDGWGMYNSLQVHPVWYIAHGYNIIISSIYVVQKHTQYVNTEMSTVRETG